MNQPVQIQVIPGVKAAAAGYSPSDPSKPLEDYSLIILQTSKGKKTYNGGVFVLNTNLPLSAEDMDNLRVVANKKLEEAVTSKEQTNEQANK